MQTQIQKGCNLTLTAPAGGVVSGSAYVIGGLLVVALASAAAGDKFIGVSEGVQELPKEATTAVFVEGEICYWDGGNDRFDESAAGRFGAGTCVEGAIATDATVKVKLHGFAVVAVA